MPGNKRPVAPWMKSLDLVVHPSHWKVNPLRCFKRWRAVSIIASRVEGNVAVLGNEHPGLFDPNSLMNTVPCWFEVCATMRSGTISSRFRSGH
jgi:hypothetical protein